MPNSGYGESAEQDNHAAEDIDPWLEASLEGIHYIITDQLYI